MDNSNQSNITPFPLSSTTGAARTPLTMSSREIAELTGSTHDNVLKTVRNLIDRGVVFGNETPYTHPQNGQTYKEFRLDYRNTMVVVSGYSAELRARIIDRWQELEEQISQPTKIDVRDQSQLTAIAIQLIEVNRELTQRAKIAEAKVEEAKPKTQFFDRFVNADGLYGLQNAGRIFSNNPNKFVSRLKQGYLFYQGGVLMPHVQYRDMGLFEVKVEMVDDKARPRTFMTPKGVQYFAKKFGLSPLEGSGCAAGGDNQGRFL